MSYDHKAIDKKWQDRWEAAGVFHAKDNDARDKFYVLVEFPYPSGAGLHVGHPRSYTALDIVARKKRMEGKNVLFPMGWDAFGLPAENYAIKTGVHPEITTKQNIDTFRRQLQSIGFSFDWSREFSTTDPAYYKWTQWMFLQFFKAGLAYKAKATINWCPKDKCGLANEEVVAGACERCGTPVEKREKEQWMIAITKYADRLIDDLKDVNYLPKIKKQQEDWIGRSEGAEVDFALRFKAHPQLNDWRDKDGKSVHVTVFTTRPDTLFGATYLVLAPEHPWVRAIWDTDHDDVATNKSEIAAYVKQATAKSEIERADHTKEKTGVRVEGVVAVNPATQEEIPIYVADYVLGEYGTGAIMAVPAHDDRDFAFAKKFSLPIRASVLPGFVGEGVKEWVATNLASTEMPPDILGTIRSSVERGETAYTHRGTLVNSGEFDGLTSDEAISRIIAWLEEKGAGRKKITYKLRDWVFSRQRYWGEPIPLVHCAKDGWVAVPDEQLPVELPKVEKYEPTDNGESPLAAIAEFVNTVCPQCGGPATRETDTMPNWAGSSWYFLRYIDPKNDKEFASAEKLQYWMPVDLYNGGMEHTTLHLLYSRFWNKFLFDQGHVPSSEPYARRHSHGLILAEDGRKMSKSWGNVVNPDDVVQEHGADTLRVYEVFMGPFEEPVPWSTNGVIGVRRFLDKVMRYVENWREAENEEDVDPAIRHFIEKAVKKVSDDIEAFKFNTAVASLMALFNELNAEIIDTKTQVGEKVQWTTKPITRNQLQRILMLLAPFAPHVANEAWENIGGSGFVELCSWPQADESWLIDEEVTIAVQVNGKLRATLEVSANIAKDDLIAAAKANENVAKHLTSEPQKIIVVPGKIVNFVL